MNAARIPTLVLLSSLAAAPPIFPQQPVTLDVVVTPGSGSNLSPIAGLHQADFVLLDNQQQRPITSFRVEPSSAEPVEAIIVVDAVNTPFTVVSSERQQIDKFLRANSGRLALPTNLAIFTDQGLQFGTAAGQDAPTRDGNALADSLASQVIGLRSIRRSAGFYGAEDRLNLSLNALQTLARHESSRPGRKLVLWVSPGWPALSGPAVLLSAHQQQQLFATIVDASGLLRQSQITLYSIDPVGTGQSLTRANYYQVFLKGIEKPSQTDLGDLSLQVLATQSGGLVFTGNNDVTAMLARAVADASAFYRISFTPPPAEHPAEYHRIQLKVEKPGFVARTRTGYYQSTPPPLATPQ